MTNPLLAKAVKQLVFVRGKYHITKLLKNIKEQTEFQTALTNSLEALREAGFPLKEPGSIDYSFIWNKKVISHLWEVYFRPGVDDEIDFDYLIEVLNDIWINSGSNTLETKNSQREALIFFADVLKDELMFSSQILMNLLNTKRISLLDDKVSEIKKRRIVKLYLWRESEFCLNIQRNKMGKGVNYIVPKIIEKKERNRDQNNIEKKVNIDRDIISEKNRRIIIVADSGMGKTLLLYEIFLRMTRKWELNKKVPFISPDTESNFIFQEDTFPGVLKARLKKTQIRIRDNQITKLVDDLIKDDQIMFMIDALDQKSNLASVFSFINSSSARDFNYILFSRPKSWEPWNSNDFIEYHLEPFDNTQLKKYYQGCSNLPLMREIDRKLLSIPMFVKMAKELIEEDGPEEFLIDNISQLYQVFVDMLFDRVEDRFRFNGNLEKIKCKDFLIELSFFSLKMNYKGSFSIDFLKDCDELNQIYPDFSHLIDLLIDIQFINIVDSIFQFRHPSFQNFFAGKKLLKLLNEYGIEKIKSFLFHPNWEDSLEFVSGLIDDKRLFESMIHSILHPDGESIFLLYNEHIRLSSLFLGESRIRSKYENYIVNRIMLKEKNDINPADIQCLGNLKAKPQLLELLKVLEGFVQNCAAEVFGLIGSENEVQQLLELIKDKNVEIQKSAVKALGIIGLENAEKALFVLLEDQNADELVRINAAYALGKIGSENASQLLLNFLKKRDISHNIRNSVSDALVEMGSETIVKHLIDLLIDNDDDVRWSAVNTLGGIGSEIAVEPLFKLLNDKNFDVRKSAIMAIGKIGSEAAIQPLFKLLKDEEIDNLIRNNVADSLIAIGSENAIKSMFLFLKDSSSNNFVRENAILKLYKIGTIKTIQLLIELLNDENNKVRCSAALALGKIGNVKAVIPLISKLKDPLPLLRMYAANALGLIGSKEAIQPLIELVYDDPHPEIRLRAALALGRIGSEIVVNDLVQLLRFEDDYLYDSDSWEAVWALSKNGSKTAILQLIELLGDNSSIVRLRSLFALGWMDVFKIKDYLSTLLSLYQNKKKNDILILIERIDRYRREKVLN